MQLFMWQHCTMEVAYMYILHHGLISCTWAPYLMLQNLHQLPTPSALACLACHLRSWMDVVSSTTSHDYLTAGEPGTGGCMVSLRHACYESSHGRRCESHACVHACIAPQPICIHFQRPSPPLGLPSGRGGASPPPWSGPCCAYPCHAVPGTHQSSRHSECPPFHLSTVSTTCAPRQLSHP